MTSHKTRSTEARPGWVRVGTVSELRARLGLADGAAAWEAIFDRPDLDADHADGSDKPWVVWMRKP